jgi:phosphoadenosine phosphosulfate reductase
VQTTSLGAEDMVVTDLIARHGLPIALATLDTGKLHAETLALIPRIEERYGLKVEVLAAAAEAVIAFVRSTASGRCARASQLRKACCGLRKLEPLGAHAGRPQRLGHRPAPRAVGRARRGALQRTDDAGRTKFNPLADWSWADVWHYIALHQVPYNPLHDEFCPASAARPARAPSRGRGLPRRPLVVGAKAPRKRLPRNAGCTRPGSQPT